MTEQTPNPEVVRAAFDFWMEARTKAQTEIQKLREICPHENKTVTTRLDDVIGQVATVHCRDCGKWLGDE